jgi:hypothetical protein
LTLAGLTARRPEKKPHHCGFFHGQLGADIQFFTTRVTEMQSKLTATNAPLGACAV